MVMKNKSGNLHWQQNAQWEINLKTSEVLPWLEHGFQESNKLTLQNPE